MRLARRSLLLAAVLAGRARAALPGWVELRHVRSEALGRPLACTIYRPAAAPAGPLPLILLLHGLAGSHRDWILHGRIVPVLDALIGAGEIPPVVVAMPEGDSGWYVDSNALGGPGDWASAIGGDLLAWLLVELPVDPAPRRRAVAALSPAIWQTVPVDQLKVAPVRLKLLSDSAYLHHVDAATVLAGINLPPPGQHVSAAFATPFDARRSNALNPFTLLARAIGAGLPLPPVYLAVGDADGLRLERGTIAMFDTLRAAARPVELRIADGGHDGAFWSATAPDLLRFLGRTLAAGGPS